MIVVTHREVEFPSDGLTLRGDLYLPAADARGTVVLMHGLASERREFDGFPSHLAERGWTALAFDRRGHGRSDGERGRLSRAWAVSDARAAVAYLDALAEAPRPYGLVGHSLGGAWATAVLADVGDFGAGVLAAPVCRLTDELKMPGEEGMYRLAGRASKLKERFGFGPLVVPYKNDYSRLFADSVARRRAEDLKFLQTTVNLGDVDELLAIDGSEWAKRVRQPTLVLVAKHDKAVQHASSRRVFASLAGTKRFDVVDSGHSMFMDRAWREVADRIDGWFTEHLVARERATA